MLSYFSATNFIALDSNTNTMFPCAYADGSWEAASPTKHDRNSSSVGNRRAAARMVIDLTKRVPLAQSSGKGSLFCHQRRILSPLLAPVLLELDDLYPRQA